MTTEINLLAILSILFFFGGGLAIALRLFALPDRRTPPRMLGIGLGFVALLFQAMALYGELITPVGLNLSIFTVAALVAWTMVLLLLLSALTKPVENLGILLLPGAGITMILAVRFPHLRLLHDSESLGLNLHILISLLAYSLLTLAAVQATLLAIQDRHLHNRHPGGFIRALPPLQTMESLLFEMIGAGFFLLSLALLSGVLFLENLFAQHLVHKTILSLVSWVSFAVLLWGRFRFGWRGRTAITWTLIGFLLLMLAYFGSKVVLELILVR
ncbi:MAG: cytochrome c biogenesis protein CcsA [Gammaproteobacteria bacterium]|nr:cytochrome c biogenesis protein CcsA [Gammaproteobacteria bacterium]MBU1653726.1 cytochrome c biogenesis protein CcsA [Gammaproteobacteria bacterium]MBU1960894.1 cytochrome c biogenesis protein CcsA [Gammaproteobacteria bacterium]